MTSGSGEVLLVLCDVGPTFGVGHVMRCVALAEEFAAGGTEVVFAADVASVPFSLAQIEARGFSHLPAPVDLEQALGLVDHLGASGVIVDSYHLPTTWYDALAEQVPTLAFVDGDPGGRSASLLLDQNIGAEHDTWPGSTGTRLAGLEYALMRTELLSRRPDAPRVAESEPLRVFAFFGGTDAFGAGPVLTRALIETGLPFALRVVAPTPWEDVPVAGVGQQVDVIGPTDRLADEVLAADLVVSASGTSSWELMCLGAATAFVCVADNQTLSYGRLLDAGLGLGLGRLGHLAADPSAASEPLTRALSDPALRERLRRTAWSQVDGAGRRRVREAFTALW